ncbi:MAG: DUF1598 domain-containing protein [Planctomycetaceae bacterium]|nr:DUF1598 domain-containing protein [Planctomycetaceae bacterium]
MACGIQGRFATLRIILMPTAILLTLIATDVPCQAEDPSVAPPMEVATGGAGGAAQADFDSLIELIQSTIAPTTWAEVGGEGSAQGFPGGIFVDASGVMHRIEGQLASDLSPVWKSANGISRRVTDQQETARSSRLRKVSLNRLEEQLAWRVADGLPATMEMRFLAGLNRIDYLVLDQKNSDVIIAGPAGPWFIDDEGRVVDRGSRRPVLRLDDLVLLLRNTFLSDGLFVCSITPTQDRLLKTQTYLAQASQQPLKPAQRKQWLTGLRDALGHQQIEVHGIPANTRVARVLIEADYHMKRIGIGLEPGGPEVASYLDRIEVGPGEALPDLGVLRWWFALREKLAVWNEDKTGIRLAPHVVRVLSENEVLSRQGKRIHTGKSEKMNREFAQDFTDHFDELANLYPVYAELDNLFRLAIIAAVLKREDIPARVNWSLQLWLSERKYHVPHGRTPREVMSIVNHRVINRKHVVAAVSGGVSFRVADLYERGFKTRVFPIRPMSQLRRAPRKIEPCWWWD